jgi:hypothetical protein
VRRDEKGQARGSSYGHDNRREPPTISCGFTASYAMAGRKRIQAKS